jgi:hypothetical protein
MLRFDSPCLLYLALLIQIVPSNNSWVWRPPQRSSLLCHHRGITRRLLEQDQDQDFSCLQDMDVIRNGPSLRRGEESVFLYRR